MVILWGVIAMIMCLSMFLAIAPLIVLIVIGSKAWRNFDDNGVSPKATVRRFDRNNPYTLQRLDEEIKGAKIRQQLAQYEKEKNERSI